MSVRRRIVGLRALSDHQRVGYWKASGNKAGYQSARHGPATEQGNAAVVLSVS